MDKAIEDRFWAKVDKSGGPDACWTWTAAINKAGYGICKVEGHTGAHRVAYLLTHGALTDGLIVCHKCDNPPCVNPAHLYEGTAADNMRDAQQRGHKSNGYRKPPIERNIVIPCKRGAPRQYESLGLLQITCTQEERAWFASLPGNSNHERLAWLRERIEAEDAYDFRDPAQNPWLKQQQEGQA